VIYLRYTQLLLFDGISDDVQVAIKSAYDAYILICPDKMYDEIEFDVFVTDK